MTNSCLVFWFSFKCGPLTTRFSSPNCWNPSYKILSLIMYLPLILFTLQYGFLQSRSFFSYQFSVFHRILNLWDWLYHILIWLNPYPISSLYLCSLMMTSVRLIFHVYYWNPFRSFYQRRYAHSAKQSSILSFDSLPPAVLKLGWVDIPLILT